MIFFIKNNDLSRRGSDIQSGSVFFSHIFIGVFLYFFILAKLLKNYYIFSVDLFFFAYLSQNTRVISKIIHIFVRNRNVTTMEQTTDNTSATNGKENIAAYRERIVAAICQAKDKNGNARYNEEEARELSEELSDEDLAFGMDYNTPEEVAELLVDSGLA